MHLILEVWKYSSLFSYKSLVQNINHLSKYCYHLSKHHFYLFHTFRQAMLKLFFSFLIINTVYVMTWHWTGNKHMAITFMTNTVNTQVHKPRQKSFQLLSLGYMTQRLSHWDPVMHTCVSKLTITGQIMACRLVGPKTLPESMLVYWQLNSWEQISVKS